MMKKNILFLLAAVLLPLGAMALQVSLHVEPSSPVAGEYFALRLKFDRQGKPRFAFPQIPGMSLLKNSVSTQISQQIINGKSELNVSYIFQAVAERPGKYTIPSFKVTVNGESAETAPVEVTVRDASELAKLPVSDRVTAALKILPERKVYTGEILQANLSVIVPENLRLRSINGMECRNFADAVFLKQGQNHQDFVQTGSYNIRRNGVNSQLFELSGFFQVQKSGIFQPECLLESIVQSRSRQRSSFFDDDFFGFSRGNDRQMRVIAKAEKPLEVLPLPPAPAGVTDLKLIGKWQISCRMPDKIKCGEVAEITLNIYGNTPVINFHPPQFDIPGARVYPPEVKRSADSVVVKYMLVPLSEGKKVLKLSFAVFDPETGKYNISQNDLVYTVIPGTAVNMGITSSIDSSGTKSETFSTSTQNEQSEPGKELPFTPVQRTKSVNFPLLTNNIFWIILILALSALLVVTDIILGIKRQNRAADQLKYQQKRELKNLISQLKKSAAPSAVLHQEGIGAIAEALGLPRGATAGEIAEKTDDEELKNFFNDLASAGFNPGAKISETPQLTAKLCRWLKNLMIFLIVAGGFTNLSGKMFDKGHEAFEKGKYAEAKNFFSGSIDPDSPSPGAYFNTACSAAMLGEYPLATLRFEQALLLSPWNSEFREAHKRMLAKIPGDKPLDDGSFGAFVIFMRDSLRPDNYLLCASFMVLALAVIFCLRRRMLRGYRIAFESIFVLLLFLSLLAAYTQCQSTYSPDRARIIVPNAQLRSLPVLSSGEVISTVPAGTEVRIVERRNHWYRITSPHYSGWIKQDEVNGILPGKLF